LSIRPAVDEYKSVPHPFQIVCTKSTRIQEIENLFFQRSASSFVHLDVVETLPLNSIIGNAAILIVERLV